MEPDNDRSESVISVRGLTKRYRGSFVTRDLDLDVPRGSIYGLLGANGAGKTTTLRMLLGLVRPTRGSVTLMGKDALRDPAARQDVGGMIEAPAVYRHLTGRENLRVLAHALRVPTGRIDEVLEVVGILDAADRVAREYSLGMVQRLGIALALLGDPAVLVLDEPQNGLDPAGMRDMRALLRELRSRGYTLLVASHLLGEVEQVATHVGLVTGGSMAFEGRLDEFRIRARPGLRIEVDDPARAQALLASLDSRLTWEREGRTLHIPPGGTAGADMDPAEVARVLVHGDVDLRRLEPIEPTLESAFFSVSESGSGAVPQGARTDRSQRLAVVTP